MGHLTLIVLHTVFPFLYAWFPVRGDITDICYFLYINVYGIWIMLSFHLILQLPFKKSGADLSL